MSARISVISWDVSGRKVSRKRSQGHVCGDQILGFFGKDSDDCLSTDKFLNIVQSKYDTTDIFILVTFSGTGSGHFLHENGIIEGFEYGGIDKKLKRIHERYKIDGSDGDYIRASFFITKNWDNRQVGTRFEANHFSLSGSISRGGFSEIKIVYPSGRTEGSTSILLFYVPKFTSRTEQLRADALLSNMLDIAERNIASQVKSLAIGKVGHREAGLKENYENNRFTYRTEKGEIGNAPTESIVKCKEGFSCFVCFHKGFTTTDGEYGKSDLENDTFIVTAV